MSQIVIPDETLLREPGLLVPGRKPVGPVKIDWSHPLARGLCFSFIPQAHTPTRIFDLANEKYLPMSFSGGAGIAAGRDRHGLYYGGDVLSHRDSIDVTSSVQGSNTEWTFEFIIRWSGTAGEFPYLFDFGSSPRMVIGHSFVGNSQFGFYDGGWTYFRTLATASGQLRHGLMTLRSDGSAKLIEKLLDTGQTVEYDGGSTYTPIAGTASTIMFGQRYDPNGDTYSLFENDVYMVNVYRRGMSDGEIYAHLADPYQFLIPA